MTSTTFRWRIEAATRASRINLAFVSAEFESLWDGVLPPRDLGGPSPADVPSADEAPEPASDQEAKPTPRRRRGPAPQPA